MGVCRTLACKSCQLKLEQSYGDKCMWSRAISDAVSTSISLQAPTGLYACVSWVPSGEYNLSARRIKGIIRRGVRGYRGKAGRRNVPKKVMLASVLLNMCLNSVVREAGSDKAETKL
jgi:hypothetical protein